jgi:bisphosphoglycerate-dependent phosphoglycerate mutase
MADKIYFNGFGGIKKSTYGVKLSGKAEKLIEAINSATNEKGYVNLELLEKKDGADKYGNTHYMIVDQFIPKSEKPF